MKLNYRTIILATAAAAVAYLQAQEKYPDPHDYIESGFKLWKMPPNGGETTFQEFARKLTAIKNALPEEEAALKAKIDSGMAALHKMRDTEDDSDLNDLSGMAAALSKYYLANKTTITSNPQGALNVAYQALDGGHPLRFFQRHMIGEITSEYVHRYRQARFNAPIPAYAKTAMVDSLEWVTEGGDGELSGLNTDLVYTFGSLWNLVSPRLATMEATQREMVLDQLEIVMGVPGEKDSYGVANGVAATANLAAARATYPEVPDPMDPPPEEEE